MRFDILTIFPNIFKSFMEESLLGAAIRKGIISLNILNIREWTTDKNRTTDDYPYGGGPGMIMKVEPIVNALDSLNIDPATSIRILLSPSGFLFNQDMAWEFSRYENIVIICGRYEGIDARISRFVDREVSVGDYILLGGEVPAMIIIEAVSRLIDGVLGNRESILSESFESKLLEAPQWTRPREFRGMKVPDILLSGDHKAIEEWRREKALELTKERRPDLYERIK